MHALLGFAYCLILSFHGFSLGVRSLDCRESVFSNGVPFLPARELRSGNGIPAEDMCFGTDVPFF